MTPGFQPRQSFWRTSPAQVSLRFNPTIVRRGLSLPRLNPTSTTNKELMARWIADWLVTKGYETKWLVPREHYPCLVVGKFRDSS